MRFSDGYQCYSISDLPGCSQVAVSHGLFIFPEFRGKGLGHSSMEARLQKIKSLGYDQVICTVEDSNIPQVKCLQKAGWNNIHSFTSSRTGHKLSIYIKNLEDQI